VGTERQRIAAGYLVAWVIEAIADGNVYRIVVGARPGALVEFPMRLGAAPENREVMLAALAAIAPLRPIWTVSVQRESSWPLHANSQVPGPIPIDEGASPPR
jgi:hypothetical protein